MSVDASININLIKSRSTNVILISVLRVLMGSGWRLIHNGYINYLVLDETGNFDWRAEILDLNQFTSILHNKEQQSKIIAVEITWEDTGVGGALMFRPKEGYESFSLSLEAKRRDIKLSNNYEITDFQWYLEKLLPPLNDAFGVEYFSCEEHR